MTYAVPRRANRIKPMAACALTAGMLLVLAPMVARMVASPEGVLRSRAFNRIVSGDMDHAPTEQGWRDR
jgi:hypothetical protein